MSNNVLTRELVGAPQYLRSIMGNPRALRAISGTVAFGDARTPVVIGRIPADAFVLGVFVEVATAFNSSGTDLIDVGTAADPDGFAVDVNGATAGIKYEADGILIGEQAAAGQVEVLYSQSVADATAGEAHVAVLYLEPS